MTVIREDFQNRPSWRVETAKLRLRVMECGGHIAEIVLRGDSELNPLWVPSRPTIDSDMFDATLHGAIYGTNSEAKLLSGLLGHNLCFPFWGDPSEAEAAAGMTFHGETNIVRWQEEPAPEGAFRVAAHLPESGLRFVRTIRFEGDSLVVESAAENLTAWDRPIAWCEHVTFGPPFLAPGITQFEASAGRGFRTGERGGPLFHWPEGRGEIVCQLSTFSTRPHRDLVNSFLVDQNGDCAFFRATHPGYGLQIEYGFNRTQFPWLNVWENNQAGMVTRGMEFSNTPRHGTMKKLIQSSGMWGTQVYDWLDARGTLVKHFRITLKRVGEG